MRDKRCARCGETKPVETFYPQKSSSDGYSSWCRRCRAAYSKEYRQSAKGQAATRSSYRRRIAALAENPPNVPPTKQCSRCREVKPASEFSRNKSAATGLQSQCKACSVEAAREWNAAHPERWRQNLRAVRLRSAFGLTPAQYDEMLQRQGGACAICRVVPTGRNRLAVDHCHTGNNVRGLLCHRCNTAIGLFKDDPELLTAAIAYITAASTVY